MPPHYVQTANSHTNSRRPRVGVLGATLGTGNLGVDALGMSMVQGLVKAIPDVEIVYQSWDLRMPVDIPLGNRTIQCESFALRRKGSLRRRDGLVQVQKMARLRSWLADRSIPQLPTLSHSLKQLLSCDVVLDVSAGDSFATIYGEDVFWYQTQIKLLCLELGLPLVLMPQTYGPFNNREAERTTASILSRATLVCSREAQGIAEIQAICGDQQPQRVVQVPDMAFLLEPSEISLPARFMRASEQNATRIAMNISGLLYFARRSFGLDVDYKQLSLQLVRWALAVPNSHVLLVPHVVAPKLYPGTKNPTYSLTDSTDRAACEKVLAELTEAEAARVDILSPPNDPTQAKFAIDQCDFFLGARMHAFIGAISQRVPGALLAYSKKANGLTQLLNINGSVVDLRENTLKGCVAQVDTLFQRREEIQKHLHQEIPKAKDELTRFFSDEIAPLVLGRMNPTPTSKTCESSSSRREEVWS